MILMDDLVQRKKNSVLILLRLIQNFPGVYITLSYHSRLSFLQLEYSVFCDFFGMHNS